MQTQSYKLNFSPFKSDGMTGRQVLLAGFYTSIFILIFFRFYNFSADVSFMGNLAGAGGQLSDELEKFQTNKKIGAWITFLLGMGLPAIMLIRGRTITKVIKGVSFVLFLPSIILATGIVGDEGSSYNYVLSASWQPTIWAKLYLAAQICCVVGIIMNGRKEITPAAMLPPIPPAQS